MNKLVNFGVVSVLLIVAFLTGCQGAAPATESKPGAAPTKPAAEKAAPAADKSEPAASPKSAATTGAADKAAAKPGAVPASLPSSTQQYLKNIQRDASFLSGLDDELKVPQEWIDGAQKEGKLTIMHTLDPEQALVLLKPFEERYPFIKVTYNRGADEDKVKAITAAQSGRPNSDVIIGVGGHFFIMKENDMIADLRELPNWKNVPDFFKEANGGWLGIHIRHWGFAYNTNKVKKEDLPKTWDDLLTNPIWRNGNLALANRPQLWMLQLWRVKGEDWTRNFIDKLFSEVKPQLRREDINAQLGLLGAGEFYATVPNGEFRVQQKVEAGSPISFWAPDPLPEASSELTILKKAASPNAARLFSNWMVSKEGQVAQYNAEYAPPVHIGLQDPALVPFYDVINGKQPAIREPSDEETIQPTLLKIWEQAWLKGGGTSR